jgi:hypothetical protein
MTIPAFNVFLRDSLFEFEANRLHPQKMLSLSTNSESEAILCETLFQRAPWRKERSPVFGKRLAEFCVDGGSEGTRCVTLPHVPDPETEPTGPSYEAPVLPEVG